MTEMSKIEKSSECPYVVGRVYIDNFEDFSSMRDNDALSRAESVLVREFEAYGAVWTKSSMGRYTIYIEHENLKKTIETNFSILDKAREIKTQRGISITLSIAFGVSKKTIKEASRACYQAMDLVMGRGGDQAIIKTDEQFNFYGGKYQTGEKYSKVKVRVFAKSLRNLMEQYEKIVITGHSMADFDSLGAVLGIAECSFSMDKKTYVLLDDQRFSVERILKAMVDDPKWGSIIISPDEAREICDSRTMVIICDTQRRDSLPLPEIVELAGAVSLIDHHRRSIDSISSTLDFIQVSASSTSEMVSEIITYFSYNLEMSSIAATAMLSGILVDTKNFTVNTSSRTFESAAFLRMKGADNHFIQSIFQDNFDYFKTRAEIIKKTEFPFDSIAVCAYKGKHKNLQMIAAQASDQLVALKDVRAAFILTRAGKRIVISARSSGDFNCQRIAEFLGGGGHFNVAGVQMHGVDIDKAKEMVIYAISRQINGMLVD